MTNPKISIVVTARNDNYGGFLEERIHTFSKILASNAENNKLQTELIFVEYNPPEDKILFSQSLKLPTNDYFHIRYIVVPRSFHLQFSTNTKIPLLEYIAKNIGIRRSRGEYILVGNPDVIIPNEIFSFITSDKIDKGKFYRVDRCDTTIDSFSKDLSYEEILRIAKKNVSLKWVNGGARYYAWGPWFQRFIHGRNKKSLLLCPLLNKWHDKKQNQANMHVQAAGDFLIAHRDWFFKASGYDETPLSSYLDGYILYVFKCLGAKQEVLPFPIYHIEHQVGKGGRPEVAFQKFEKDTKKMLETGVPYRGPDQNWGHPNEKFDEIELE